MRFKELHEQTERVEVNVANVKKAIDTDGLIFMDPDRFQDPWFYPKEVNGDSVMALDGDGEEHEFKLSQIDAVIIGDKAKEGGHSLFPKVWDEEPEVVENENEDTHVETKSAGRYKNFVG